MKKFLPKAAICPKREEDFPEWYQQVIKEADLAEHSEVRGCMVIKPWGYGIWENVQNVLNKKIKETGHQNAYFPLFIPLSLLEKEAEHIEGFAKECAVVTHSRLAKNQLGKLVPEDPLEEPYVVRPTSEMIIGHTFAKWIESYRDLPLKINQWANIVRWEMRPRLFLRTVEFLWQEGHTVHASEKEAFDESRLMLDVYDQFLKEWLAIPSIAGRKTAFDRFPGAVETFSLEAMMQDKKALQACTSHFLGQNFSKSCGIKFSTQEGKVDFGYTTSWGMTSRVIGGLIMVHGDDDGLVLPPKIAPAHLVLMPHLFKEKENVVKMCEEIKSRIEKISYAGKFLEVIIDVSDKRGGEKKWHWVKKGIPLRIEVGEKELTAQKFSLSRRDKPLDEKNYLSLDELENSIVNILDDMQKNLFAKAQSFLTTNLVEINSKEDLFKLFEEKGHEQFALCHVEEDAKIEAFLKEKLNVNIRSVPFEIGKEAGKSIFTKEKCAQRVVIARSY